MAGKAPGVLQISGASHKGSKLPGRAIRWVEGPTIAAAAATPTLE